MGNRSGVLRPREAPAVDDGAAQRRAMPADELGERVNDDVGAMMKRLEHQRRGDSVVDDERHAGSVRDIGHRLKVDDVARRIADRLDEHATRSLVDEPSDRLGPVVGREARLDTEGRQHVREVGVRRAIELGATTKFDPAVATVRIA